MNRDKIFVHIDGDAFFVACEVARRPELAGLSVVVGEERGIVTALSYEAKRIGIKRGDPIFKIRKEYKSVVVLQSHFDLYLKYSHMLYSILTEYTSEVEAYSVDECFMSFPSDYFKNINLEEFFSNLKRRVKMETGITYSFGISYSKVTAKLASKHNKPDGLCFFLDEEELLRIYKIKSVSEIWGIGLATKKSLESLGIITIDDFVNYDIKLLDKYFNKNIMELYHELRWDNRLGIIKESKDLKSLQATRSFTNITNDKSYVFSELSRNIEQAAERLSTLDLYTNEFIIFLKTHTKSLEYSKTIGIKIKLKEYTRDVRVLIREACDVYERVYDTKNKYKKTGVSMLNLKKVNQIESSLLDLLVQNKREEKDLSGIINSIKNKVGAGKLCLASSLVSRKSRETALIRRNINDNYFYNLPLPYMGIVFCK